MTTEQFDITDDQICFFREKGYLNYGPILTPEELDELRDEVQRFIAGEQSALMRQDLGGAKDTAVGEEKFVQISGLWKVSSTVRRFATMERRARIAAALLGVEKIRLLSDMVLFKPPGGSRTTEWHQDYPDHPTSLPDITAWTALDPTTVANGCMQYIPGSHHWGEVMGYDYEGGAAAKRGIDLSTAVAVELQPGEAVFHHSLSMHYAGPNNTDTPRRAYITRLMPAETVHRFQRADRDSKELEGTPFSDEDYPVLTFKG